MTSLDRIVFRELIQSKSRTSVLLVALAVAFLLPAGLEMGLRSLLATRDAFASSLSLADLEIRMLPEDLQNLPSLEVPGLERVESRLLMPGTIERNGKTINAVVVFTQEQPAKINELRMRAGRALSPGPQPEAVIERSAVEFLGYNVGDDIAVQVGHKLFEQKVVGVAASPEFLMVAANPEYFLPEKGSLVVVYTHISRVYDELGFLMVNDLLFRFKPGANPEVVKKAILQRLSARKIERVTSREEHLSWRHIAIDSEVFRIFQPAISTILTLLAGALVIITFNGFVRKQRRELGTLKAMGYSGWEVTRSYVLAGISLGVAGAVLGAVGSIAFRNAFLAVYSQAHGLAYLERHLYGDVLLRSFLTIMLLSVVCAAISTWKVRGMTPQSLMRAAQNNASTSYPDAASTNLLAALPFAIRLGLKNMMRSPRLTAVTVCGVALTISVGVAYLICLDSMKHAMVESFESQQWNSAVSFAYPVLDEEYGEAQAKFPSLLAEGYVRTPGTVSSGDREYDVSVLGIQASGSMRGARIVEGRMARGEDEIVVGGDLAGRLGASIGSTLTLSLRSVDHHVKIVGVKADVLLGEVIMTLPVVQRWTELENQATGMFLRHTDGGSHAAAVGEYLRGQDYVARVTDRNNLVAEFMNILQDIRKLVILVASIALLVAIIFIVANLNMTMQERTSEFATLWALGCRRGTAMQVIVADGGAQACLALLLAVPTTWLLAGILNKLASEAWFQQTTYISPTLVAVSVVTVLFLTAISVVAGFVRFWRPALLQNLRARAIQ